MLYYYTVVNLKSFSRQVTDSRTILHLKIVFLKPYNPTLFLNLTMEVTQLSVMVKLTDI